MIISSMVVLEGETGVPVQSDEVDIINHLRGNAFIHLITAICSSFERLMALNYILLIQI